MGWEGSRHTEPKMKRWWPPTQALPDPCSKPRIYRFTTLHFCQNTSGINYFDDNFAWISSVGCWRQFGTRKSVKRKGWRTIWHLFWHFHLEHNFGGEVTVYQHLEGRVMKPNKWWVTCYLTGMGTVRYGTYDNPRSPGQEPPSLSV